MCASANNLKRNDINKRLLKLTFRGQTLNKGTEHEGYVCTSIDNILLGGIKLPQRKTQVDTVKRLSSEINDFLKLDDAKISVNFQDNSKKMTICEINISFTKESKVWKVMKACVNEFILDGEHFIPVVPSKILNATNITLKRDFLRGYFGFRSRISKSDRYPNGKLRLALQIDTGAQKFADQIKEILTKDFKIQAQLNDGSARDRDNMIRMIPTQSASNLYSKGWMRLLISEFIKFNQQFDK